MKCKDFHIVRVYLDRNDKRRLDMSSGSKDRKEVHEIIRRWTDFKKLMIESFSGMTFGELQHKYFVSMYECGIALMYINSDIYMTDGGMYYTFFIPIADTKAAEWFDKQLTSHQLTYKVIKRIPLGWISLVDRKEISKSILDRAEELAKARILL